MSSIASSTNTPASSASSTSTATSSSVQFPGFPTGSRRPNASTTSRQTQPGGGGENSNESSKHDYYLGVALAILLGALLIWRQCRVRQRRRLRPVIAPQPSLSGTKPCLFDAYLAAEKKALGEKVGLWEYTMPLSIVAEPLLPPQEQPARKGDAPAPSIPRVAVLIAMPAPPVKKRSADNEDKNSDLPYLEIGTLETDLLHAQ
ncbi:hypothetical protein FB451DRAFT_180807 [Mycena latifolia]|nr:hypothetical protein FB451DRAFT_180807 [Mycena latifolia]